MTPKGDQRLEALRLEDFNEIERVAIGGDYVSVAGEPQVADLAPLLFFVN